MNLFPVVLLAIPMAGVLAMAGGHWHYHTHPSVRNTLRRHTHLARGPYGKPFTGVGIAGARWVPPVYTPGYSSPLVVDAGSDVGESGVTLVPSVVGNSRAGSMGIYVSPPRNGKMVGGRDRLVSLHHLIHHAQGEALKAEAISSAAKLRTSALLARSQDLNARMMANKAEMLKEEEQRLLAQRSADPQILVKDTIPVANVVNNNLSFEHHNELLNRKLNMIKNDQDRAVRKAESIAQLHKARTPILPDSLATSDPKQFKDFVDSGPTRDLTFEVPVDPSIGSYYVSTLPGEELRDEKAGQTVGDLPYFIAHRNGFTPHPPLHVLDEEARVSA